MIILFKLAAELAAVVCTVVLTNYLVLVYRNPLSGRFWMREGSDAIVAVVGVACLSISMAYMTNGIAQLGVQGFLAFGIALVVYAACSAIAWRLMGMRWRIERTVQGLSPFRGDDRAGGPAAPRAPV